MVELLEYLKSKKINNETNQVDILLRNYLEDEIKQRIEEELNKI